MDTINIPVEGMTCGGCVSSVQRALARVSGVAEAVATLSPGAVAVRFDASAVNVAGLVSAIEDAGYGVPAAWLTERHQAASIQS